MPWPPTTVVNVLEIELDSALVESLENRATLFRAQKRVHPVVGECDGLGELARAEIDARSRVCFVSPVGVGVCVEDCFHLPKGIVAVFGTLAQEIGECGTLDALGHGVDEDPVPVLVLDVELRPAGND